MFTMIVANPLWRGGRLHSPLKAAGRKRALLPRFPLVHSPYLVRLLVTRCQHLVGYLVSHSNLMMQRLAQASVMQFAVYCS
mmetsp:Transcript_20063/g.40849  ORF Transcript_20063/g.40849 Transcript_20063/m.40849 type:complete len:81 (+) Transcript_20063:59-301(+)